MSPIEQSPGVILARGVCRMFAERGFASLTEFATRDGLRMDVCALGPKGEKIAVAHDEYCWMNAAYVLGTKLTDAFAKYNWCTAIRGAENGGMVEGLPTHIFKNDEGDLEQKCPSEVAITERRENELNFQIRTPKRTRK